MAKANSSRERAGRGLPPPPRPGVILSPAEIEEPDRGAGGGGQRCHLQVCFVLFVFGKEHALLRQEEFRAIQANASSAKRAYAFKLRRQLDIRAQDNLDTINRS